MILVGRVTKDAVVKTLKDDKEVVNFSVAVNDGYKKKGTGEWVSIPSFFNCSYWLSASVASRLTKGSLVELTGRVSVNAYKGMDGEAHASLNCHVDSLKIHGTGKKTEEAAKPEVQEAPKDDLPF